MGTSLFYVTSVVKCSPRSDHFVHRLDINQIVENALSRNVVESFTKSLDTDSEANDFQNLISSSLSTDTSFFFFSFSFGVAENAEAGMTVHSQS